MNRRNNRADLAAARGPLPAARVAAWSALALDRALTASAELLVAHLEDEAVLLGAFQRASEVEGLLPLLPRLRRGSGGAAVRVGPGTIYVGLALAHPSALVPAREDQILNRYVRPILRALARQGVLAHYFGRDWISVAKAPAALISFAHDAGSGRALVEAFVATEAPFSLGPRPSYLGKEPGTCAELSGKHVQDARFSEALIEAYGELLPGGEGLSELAVAGDEAAFVGADEAWERRIDEALGPIFSGRDGRGAWRLGGELVASRDAVGSMEEGLLALGPAPSPEEVGALAFATLAAPGVALFGVKSLSSIRDLLVGRSA